MLRRLGFEELRTPDEVDAVLTKEQAPTLVVVNSVCGCAARNARPAAALAIQHDRRPARLVTVFAGQDADATARARGYFTGYIQSSVVGGFVLSLIIVLACKAVLGPATWATWGWRVPFIISIVLLAISLCLVGIRLLFRALSF